MVVNQGVVVECPAEVLDLEPGGRRPVGDANAEPRRGLAALAERCLDALPDADLADEFRRHGVGVGVVERAVEDDVGKQC